MDKVEADDFDETTIRIIRAKVLGIRDQFLIEGILWPMLRPQNFIMDKVAPGDSHFAYNFSGTEDLESIDEDVRDDDIRIQKKYLLRWLDEIFPLKEPAEEQHEKIYQIPFSGGNS